MLSDEAKGIGLAAALFLVFAIGVNLGYLLHG